VEEKEFNIDEIITEVSWRLSNGIMNLDQTDTINVLREVLRERGYNNIFIDEFIHTIKNPNEDIISK
jgi:hypothetical protein